MMYNKKLVSAIKVNGNILREDGENVYIPFGSEYNIMLKNLNTKKATVDITIDGEDVLGGSSLLLNSGDSMELDGFLRDNKVSHRFKFIEKTDRISQYRGDKIDDGLVVIKYTFEKDIYQPTLWPNSYVFKTYHNITYEYDVTCTSNKLANSAITPQANYSCNTDGITTKGSESDQFFSTGSIGVLEEEVHTMIYHLKGLSNDNIVSKPLTVKTKILCNICGRNNKSSMKFCGNCGTSLTM